MKIRFIPRSLLFSLGLAAGVTASAQATAPAPESPRTLNVVVVESLGRGTNRLTDFDRIDIVFRKVFAKRKWPVKINVERFAANLPDHAIELRVFFQGIYEETPQDLTFHAWMTLTDHGEKHDFGIIKFRSYPRAGMDREDALEECVRGAAVAVADKIEPILFPKTEAAKP
jgi:hypothetical protein